MRVSKVPSVSLPPEMHSWAEDNVGSTFILHLREENRTLLDADHLRPSGEIRRLYTGEVQIRVLSNDEAFIRSLAGTADPALKAETGAPSFVPGAAESLWQLMVDIGAIGLPLGVAGNLIASWI